MIRSLLATAVFAFAAFASNPSTVPSLPTIEMRPASSIAVDGWKEMTPVDGLAVFVSPERLLTESDFKDAWLATTQDGARSVRITLTDEAGERFHQYTSQHLNEPIAIIQEGVLLTAPVIRVEIRSEMMIAGGPDGLSEDQASRIIAAVKKSD